MLSIEEQNRKLLEEVKNNLIFFKTLDPTIREYENFDKLMDYYIPKITRRVLDYCNTEELNAPLCDFIEEKVLRVIKYKIELEKGLEGSIVDGIDISKVQSIQRGDTSITLRDKKTTTQTESSAVVEKVTDPLQFTADDYIILNRNRRVFR